METSIVIALSGEALLLAETNTEGDLLNTIVLAEHPTVQDVDDLIEALQHARATLETQEALRKAKAH